MPNSSSFPLSGVIGVVTESATEIALAADTGLRCVEIRADQLMEAGLSITDILATIPTAKEAKLSSLFTLRHPGHGGKFLGSEEERIAINRQALQAGADMIDLEWGTEAAEQLLLEEPPMILSYHDFEGMLDESELNSLCQNMCKLGPKAIKIVPTASNLMESARMLQWLNTPGNNNIARIGFAMGDLGACSRILTTVFGAPITYATLGEPNAPGQIAIDDLMNTYRVNELDSSTTVVALIGDRDKLADSIKSVNTEFQKASENRVAIGFSTADTDILDTLRKTLRITDIRTV